MSVTPPYKKEIPPPLPPHRLPNWRAASPCCHDGAHASLLVRPPAARRLRADCACKRGVLHPCSGALCIMLPRMLRPLVFASYKHSHSPEQLAVHALVWALSRPDAQSNPSSCLCPTPTRDAHEDVSSHVYCVIQKTSSMCSDNFLKLQS